MLNLTLKERAQEHDENEASILGRVLLEHPAFVAAADRLASIHDQDQWTDAADDEASRYALKRGPYRDEIIRLLRLASDHPPVWRATKIANARRSAVWGDDCRESELSRLRVRDGTDRFVVGARRIARRGAGECVECGAPLEDVYERRLGLRPRRSRRLYCTEHETLAPSWSSVHEGDMKRAFEAATGQRRELQRRRHTSLAS